MSAFEPPPFLAELGHEFARVAEADAEAAGSGASVRPRRSRWLRLQLPWLRLALPVLVALVAFGGIGIVATGVIWRSGETTPGTSGPVPGLGANGFSDDLVQRVSVLARARTDADGIDPRFAADGALTLMRDDSLRVTPPTPVSSDAMALDRPTWLVPTDNGRLVVAMLDSDTTTLTAVASVNADDIEHGRAFGVLGLNVLGIVPDGVTNVTVTMRDGRSVELPVQDNVYGARLADEFAGVQWSGMQRP